MRLTWLFVFSERRVDRLLNRRQHIREAKHGSGGVPESIIQDTLREIEAKSLDYLIELPNGF